MKIMDGLVNRALSPDLMNSFEDDLSRNNRLYHSTMKRKPSNPTPTKHKMSVTSSTTTSTLHPSTTSSTSTSPSKYSDVIVTDLLKVSPENFATQMTIMDIVIFKAIQPEELTTCAWTTKDKLTKAPNVVSFTRRFNHINFWVQKEILSGTSVKSRGEIMGHFIKISKQLLELNNLHSAMAITSALQSAPIYRLEKTWMMLSKKEKQTYDKMSELFSENENRLKLRECTNNARLPVIPYLGLYLADLIYIDVAHPVRSDGVESESRRMKMNNILRVLSEFQQSSYDHLPNYPNIQTYLNSVRYIEELQKFVEDDNYKLSLTIEPSPQQQLQQQQQQATTLLSSLISPVYNPAHKILPIDSDINNSGDDDNNDEIICDDDNNNNDDDDDDDDDDESKLATSCIPIIIHHSIKNNNSNNNDNINNNNNNNNDSNCLFHNRAKKMKNVESPIKSKTLSFYHSHNKHNNNNNNNNSRFNNNYNHHHHHNNNNSSNNNANSNNKLNVNNKSYNSNNFLTCNQSDECNRACDDDDNDKDGDHVNRRNNFNHRKTKSLMPEFLSMLHNNNNNNILATTTTTSTSATITTTSTTLKQQQRNLIDDSIVEDFSCSSNRSSYQTLAHSVSNGTEESLSIKGRLSIRNSVDVVEFQAKYNYEGAVRRKTLFKNGKKASISSWTRYWVCVLKDNLMYFAAKYFHGTDRSSFKSEPCKMARVTGWSVIICSNRERNDDVFLLTDAVNGNTYKFKAGSHTKALEWCTALEQAVHYEGEIEVPDNNNLIVFE